MSEETKEIDKVALKKQAKQLLDGKVFKMLACYALYGIIVAGCAALCFLIPNPLQNYLASVLEGVQPLSNLFSTSDIHLIVWGAFLFVRILLLMALVHPFSVCITTVPLAIVEGTPLSWRMALAPIRRLRYFIECMIIGAAQFLITLLWSLLLIVPGVISYHRHSFTKYIFIRNIELTFGETAARSKAMTKGYEGQLFALDLSFLGWLLFGICTCGVGLLYLICYYSVTKVLFYKEIEDLSKETDKNGEEKPLEQDTSINSDDSPSQSSCETQVESDESLGEENLRHQEIIMETSDDNTKQNDASQTFNFTDDIPPEKALPDATLWTKDSDKGIRIARGDMTNLEQEAQNNLRDNKEDSV
ncbi:MAG: DUF975 family protein [Spirochaetaceae bacterium]|nr:DUF975 family protein [Spirochaetaceae bacterium]